MNRFLYLGDVAIESEVSKLIERGRSMGVSVVMTHSSSGRSVHNNSQLVSGGIYVVVVGNPRGLLSSHHEKLVLVDGDCDGGHGTAFVGGFDIARGRYDQPLHQIPLPYFELAPPRQGVQQAARFTGPAVQPVLRRIRFLWHDVQLQLCEGPSVMRHLLLHFEQRWNFACTGNGAETRALVLSPSRQKCLPVKNDEKVKTVQLQISRCWRGVLDVQKMFEAHRQAIRRFDKKTKQKKNPPPPHDLQFFFF